MVPMALGSISELVPAVVCTAKPPVDLISIPTLAPDTPTLKLPDERVAAALVMAISKSPLTLLFKAKSPWSETKPAIFTLTPIPEKD